MYVYKYIIKMGLILSIRELNTDCDKNSLGPFKKQKKKNKKPLFLLHYSYISFVYVLYLSRVILQVLF